MADATFVSRTEWSPLAYKFVYNVPSVAASGTGGEYAMYIGPITLGNIDTFSIVNASTFTVSLSDVEGGTVHPNVDEKLRVTDIVNDYMEVGLGIPFYTSNSYLFVKVTNQDSSIATGISTISMLIRR